MSDTSGTQRRGFPTRPPRDDVSIPRSDLSIPHDLHSAQMSLNQRVPLDATVSGNSGSFGRNQGFGSQPQGFGPADTGALPPSMSSFAPLPPGASQAPGFGFPQPLQPAPLQLNPPDQLAQHESVERTQTAIYALCLIDITVMALLSEFACLYRNVCHVSSGVDVSPYASHAFVPIMCLCFLHVFFAYESSTFVIRSAVRCLRISSIVFALLIILFSVAEIIAMLAMVDESERSSTWNKMSSLSQDFYDNSLGKYVEQYKANIAMLAVFQIIVAAIMLGISIALFVLAGKTTDSYVPRLSAEKRKRVLKPPTETEMQNLSVSKDPIVPPPPLSVNPVSFQLSEEVQPRGFPMRNEPPIDTQQHMLAP